MTILAKREKTETPVAFDPWPSATRIPTPPRNWAAPGPWAAMPDELRAIFGGAALEALRAHPNATRGDAAALSFRAWERARCVTFEYRGELVRVDEAMREIPAVSSAVGLLEAALLLLIECGDALATLRRERDRLDAQIGVLERLRGEEVA